MASDTPQTIPCLDLKRQYAQIRDEVMKATEEVFSNTAFSGGKYVEKFEKNFAAYCGTSFALGVNNGTSALHLAMLALGIKEGDEVIVPANTFIATAWAVSYVNATPVFVDCTSDTWEIDANKIEAKISPRTKAIIGVHLYGQPFDIDAVSAIAKRRNLFLIEDCAQAHGAKYKGVKVGGAGEMGCFSFYPGKNLGAFGEAGAVTTNSSVYAAHISALRNHGSVTRYHHDMLGFNMRMDGLQGAILDIKLKYLDQWNSRRQEIAARYFREIVNEKVKMQHQPEFSTSVFHLFVITVDNRDALISHLSGYHIAPGLHYPVPCHLQKVYAGLGYAKGDFPESEYLAEHCVSLPMYAELTDAEVSRVIEALNSF